jgi:tRNA A37 N6-isopentenylltransferase MiaA
VQRKLVIKYTKKPAIQKRMHILHHSLQSICVSNQYQIHRFQRQKTEGKMEKRSRGGRITFLGMGSCITTTAGKEVGARDHRLSGGDGEGVDPR